MFFYNINILLQPRLSVLQSAPSERRDVRAKTPPAYTGKRDLVIKGVSKQIFPRRQCTLSVLFVDIYERSAQFMYPFL